MPFEREHGEAEAVAVALRKLALAVGLEQQGQMGELGHRVCPAESAVKQHVERCGGQPFLAAYHVADFHEMVVHNIGEVVRGQFVRALVEHLVVEYVRHDFHVAANEVVHVHLFARFNLEAHHVGRAFGDEPLGFLFAQRQLVAHAEARVRVVLEVFHLLALCIEFFGRIKRHVGGAAVEQLLYVFLINVAALALPIRAIVAAEAHALVKLDAEPVEGFYDVSLCAGHEAVGIGVFDAEHEFAALLAGKQVVV